MYCYLIEDFRVSVMFLAFTQDHTVLLFNRGFSRFSDDTPTFVSCLYTGPHRCTVI